MAVRWYVVTATDTIVEITDRVRTPDPEGGEGFHVGAHADEGSAGSYSLEVDDPGADLHLLNHRRVYAIAEDAPAGHQRVGNWWISDLDIIRGDSDRTGAARTWVLTIEDENVIIPRKIQNGVDAARPAETDIERLTWLLTTTEFASVKDTLYLDTTGPVNLTAQDFTGQTNDAILQAAKDASGKNYFIWFNELAVAGVSIVSSSVANPTVITTSAAHNLLTGAEVTISGHAGSTPDINGVHTITYISPTTFSIPVNVTVGGTGGTVVEPRYSLAYFNPNTYESYASAISLSNVASEIDSTTVFAIADDTKLNRAGGRIASGAFASGPFGNVYVQDTAVAAQYVSRDLSVPAPNVTTLAAATTQVTRQLGELDEPDDEVTTRIWVTEAQINAAMHGMTIPLHTTHFPGFLTEAGYPTYQSGQLMRITRREVHQVGPDTFEIPLWLSPMPRPPEILQNYTHSTVFGCETSSWPEGSPTAGHLLIGFAGARDGGVGNVYPYTVGDEVLIGSTGTPGVCNETLDVAGTNWTFIAGTSTSNGVGQTARSQMFWREAAASEPGTLAWTLSGRTRSHEVEIDGLTVGAPTVTAGSATGLFGGDPGSVFTSPNLAATGPGYIFAGLVYRCSGPGEYGASFVMTARSPAATLTQGYQDSGFGGYTWFGYRRVESAGTYNIVLDRSAAPGDSYGIGWLMGFWPDA